MQRIVKQRRLVQVLVVCVALLGAAAGAALWHAFKPMLALSGPSPQTNGFHVAQLQMEYERFLEALWTFSAGKSDAGDVSLRLDLLASRLAPARELTAIAELPGPSEVLHVLDRKIDAWTPPVNRLRDDDPASRADVSALIEEVKDFRPRLQDMVIETNHAFVDQRDRERGVFYERFRWLLMAIAALVAGVVILVGVLWRQLKRSGQLGDSLTDLNFTLENRVALRTRQLEERQRQLHTILDASPISVALLRLSDRETLFVNQRFRQQFDTPGEIPLDSPARFGAIFASEEDAQDFWRFFHVSRSLEDYEVRLRPAPGVAQAWSLVSARELVMDGVPVLLFWAYDISTRKELEAELRQLAHTDPLTGALNRRAFTERSESAIATARRQQRPLALLMLDIDHFKQVNDSHGHAAGDLAILQVTQLAQRSLRPLDLLGRLGGEEFGVLLPEASPNDAAATAERLRLAVAEHPLDAAGIALKVTVSIGVASLAPGEDLDALYHRADEALYTAKRNGRNRVHRAEGEFSDSKR